MKSNLKLKFIIFGITCILIGVAIGVNFNYIKGGIFYLIYGLPSQEAPLIISDEFEADGFCGWSTYAKCESNIDCMAGGCSNQLCEGLNEGTMTTCLYRSCYDANKYGYGCKCVDNKCQWSV